MAKLSFAAEGIYSDGSTSPLINKVTWHSSAIDIAKIDDKGILTGIAIGTVEVKASYEGIESNIINVRITDAILTSMNISVRNHYHLTLLFIVVVNCHSLPKAFTAMALHRH
ncbi:Ig-like domain-containing protein [Photobacterium leiognathi]|uniref:Ig-like domain-containing protein n=1 Tax=Photobacterium leiognathi TaxID=553611 RepID=UPI00273971BE|nr:Ig-like domain-containing protein [Photobacterium leiognathi]